MVAIHLFENLTLNPNMKVMGGGGVCVKCQGPITGHTL